MKTDQQEPSGFPLRISIGDKYGPAMEIRDEAEAKAYYDRLIRHNLECQTHERKLPKRAEAERVEKINLGYYAGYYDGETRERVESLFDCAHPVFGKIAEKGRPDPNDALCKGLMAGVAAKRLAARRGQN